MNLTAVQKEIGNIVAFAIGIISLVLFFKGIYLWAGIAIILMGSIAIFMERQGAELNVLIGFIPILLHYQQMKLLLALMVIICISAIFDLFVLIQIRSNLQAKDKKEREKEFFVQFREKELIHVVFTKLINFFALKSPARIE